MDGALALARGLNRRTQTFERAVTRILRYLLIRDLGGQHGGLCARAGENVHPTIRHWRGIMGRMGLLAPPFFMAQIL